MKMKKSLTLAGTIALGLSILLFSSAFAAETYGLVINNGRVMDPETKFDDIRNMGIKSINEL